MNENLNLVAILKDCPKGTKLYSSVLGEVELEGITDSVNYPIIVKLNEELFGERIIETFTSDGRLIATCKGECVLFPSSDQRDWSKFTAPWYNKVYTRSFRNYINSMSNKDDERLRKTAIAFLKDFAEQGYENAVECIDWLEKQGEEYKVSSDKQEWRPSTEHPAIDEEVIALVGENKMISFAHIVDKNKAIDYDGWNIPDVKCWIPFPKIEEN